MMMTNMMIVVVVTETMKSRPSKGGRKVRQRSVKITDQGPESQRVPFLQLPTPRRQTVCSSDDTKNIAVDGRDRAFALL